MKKKKQYKFNNFFTKTITILTVIAAIALIVSDFAGNIDPNTFWIPAFAGLAYVPLFLVNFAFLILNIIRRNKWISLAPLLALLLGWNIASDTFSLKPSSPLAAKASPGALRLLTWNIHYFQDIYDSPAEESQASMLSLIKSSAADVVCLEEFAIISGDTTTGIGTIKKHLQTPYSFFQPLEAPDRGMAVFSKYPITGKGMIAFSDQPSGNQCIFADILKDGKTVRVYAVHLESIRLRNEQLNYISSLVKGKEDNIKPSKRIAGQVKRAFLARSEQVKLVKDDAAKCPYPYLICGDFNDPPSSFAFRQMARGMKSAFAEKGSGFFPVTYYRGLLKYQIDHILASSQFNIRYHHIIAQKLSDHYPVLADTEL